MAKDNLKFMLFNIFEGGKPKNRLSKIKKFINSQNPDVLGLLELNDWDEKLIKDFLSNTNFQDYVFCKTSTGFNLAIFSKFKLKNKKCVTKSLHHGLISCNLSIPHFEGIHLFLTHLNPFDPLLRLKELKKIISNIPKNEKILLMGDLNSLSPYDNYNLDELKKIFIEKEITKFGEKEINFDCFNFLIKNSFVDTLNNSSNNPEYSVPTKFNTDYTHATKLRLDYMFISSNIQDKLISSLIMRNKETNILSDHFPLVTLISK